MRSRTLTAVPNGRETIALLQARTGSDGIPDPAMNWRVWPDGCGVCGGAVVAADDLPARCVMGRGCRPEALLAALRQPVDRRAEDIFEVAVILHDLDQYRRDPDNPAPPWGSIGRHAQRRLLDQAAEALDTIDKPAEMRAAA